MNSLGQNTNLDEAKVKENVLLRMDKMHTRIIGAQSAMTTPILFFAAEKQKDIRASMLKGTTPLHINSVTHLEERTHAIGRQLFEHSWLLWLDLLEALSIKRSIRVSENKRRHFCLCYNEISQK